MKSWRYALAAALWMCPVAVAAEQSAPPDWEPVYLSGTIGNTTVLVTLERHGENVDGWYKYLLHGKSILLQGKVGADGRFRFQESLYPAPTVTGVWQGTVHGAQWSGTWTKRDGGAPVALALAENHDRLTSLSGQFSCTAQQADRKSGYTFSEAMNLTVARGNVTKLALSHTARGNGDEQMCGLGLSDLERASSPTGILFRAKGDDREDISGEHCSVRIVAAGDYLYLQVGDATEDGNECLGIGDSERFCTPRGNWNDLILNRKTGACTMVQ